MGKRKAFINKRKATTFKLLNRSQKDPLIADDTAGDHVLYKVSSGDLEERSKYGIYYRDNYDYLKHLKEVGEVIELDGFNSEIIRLPNSMVNLPNTIFETQGIELKVGLLNQNAPTNELLPDIDPEIVAALEGELVNDVAELEDDFMQHANPDLKMETTHQKERITDPNENEIMQRFGLIRNQTYSDDEYLSEPAGCDSLEGDNESSSEQSEDNERVNCKTRKANKNDDRGSHFTNYSMTSAVIHRSDGLRLIDEHFERFYEDYTNESVGTGNDAEFGLGREQCDLNDTHLGKLHTFMQENLSQTKYKQEKPTNELKSAVLAQERRMQVQGEETETILVRNSKHSQWDCESIVSSYSTLYNHPTLIKVPFEGSRKRRLSTLHKSQTDAIDVDDEAITLKTYHSIASTFRPKGENAEERRIRKQAVREERRERRQKKKSTKVAFKIAKIQMDGQKHHAQPTKWRPIK